MTTFEPKHHLPSLEFETLLSFPICVRHQIPKLVVFMPRCVQFARWRGGRRFICLCRRQGNSRHVGVCRRDARGYFYSQLAADGLCHCFSPRSRHIDLFENSTFALISLLFSIFRRPDSPPGVSRASSGRGLDYRLQRRARDQTRPAGRCLCMAQRRESPRRTRHAHLRLPGAHSLSILQFSFFSLQEVKPTLIRGAFAETDLDRQGLATSQRMRDKEYLPQMAM
jgi:hypothetical protein